MCTQNKQVVVDLTTDSLQHPSPSHESPPKHTDIASLLVNTLSSTVWLIPRTPTSNNHNNPFRVQFQLASLNLLKPLSLHMAPALDGAARVTQQAQMAIRSILANANAQQKPDNLVWNLSSVTVPPTMTASTDVARTNGQVSALTSAFLMSA